MSKKNPECPAVVPRNCSDYKHRRVCALVRSDKKCFHNPGKSRERIRVNIGPGHQYKKPQVVRNVQTTVRKGNSSNYVWRRR